MKARVIKTGEVVSVYRFIENPDIWYDYANNCYQYKTEELDFDIDFNIIDDSDIDSFETFVEKVDSLYDPEDEDIEIDGIINETIHLCVKYPAYANQYFDEYINNI